LSDVRCKFICTPQAHLDAAKASGQTKLYDALLSAEEQLTKLSESFPKCRMRILCLTDGEDTCSAASPEVVAASLQSSKIVVDSVLIGPSNRVLKAISVATGGACFNPTNMQAALVRGVRVLLSSNACVVAVLSSRCHSANVRCHAADIRAGDCVVHSPAARQAAASQDSICCRSAAV
jgi:hypothetical protein